MMCPISMASGREELQGCILVEVRAQMGHTSTYYPLTPSSFEQLEKCPITRAPLTAARWTHINSLPSDLQTAVFETESFTLDQKKKLNSQVWYPAAVQHSCSSFKFRSRSPDLFERIPGSSLRGEIGFDQRPSGSTNFLTRQRLFTAAAAAAAQHRENLQRLQEQLGSVADDPHPEREVIIM